MKKKILSLLLVLAVVFSAVPMFTVQADAFSTGAKTLAKTKTVTIKPGKTYKSKAFKLSKKMAIQVPIKIKLAKKNLSDSDYNYKLSYKMSLKTSKGKTKATYSVKDLGIANVYDGTMGYDDVIYYYDNKISKPGFAKGKYYLSIKNTSKKTIKVTFSVRGYAKFATKADIKKNIKADVYDIQNYAGRIGPGLPVVKTIKSSNPDVDVYWYITKDGKLYLQFETSSYEDQDSNLTIKLITNKTFKTKVHITGDPEMLDTGE